MKKMHILILFLPCVCLLGACRQPPAEPNARSPVILVGDVIYYYTGQEIQAQVRAGDVLGEVASQVPLSEWPQENGESNFAPQGAPYARYEEGALIVSMNGKWLLFEQRNAE